MRNRLRPINLPIVVLAGMLPVLALSMQVVQGEKVCFRVFPEATLPTICFSRNLGFDCPLCGMTRSVIFFVRGDWTESLAAHRLGWLVFLAIIAQIPWQFLSAACTQKQLISRRKAAGWCWGLLAVLLLVNRLSEFV